MYGFYKIHAIIDKPRKISHAQKVLQEYGLYDKVMEFVSADVTARPVRIIKTYKIEKDDLSVVAGFYGSVNLEDTKGTLLTDNIFSNDIAFVKIRHQDQTIYSHENY